MNMWINILLLAITKLTQNFLTRTSNFKRERSHWQWSTEHVLSFYGVYVRFLLWPCPDTYMAVADCIHLQHLTLVFWFSYMCRLVACGFVLDGGYACGL